MLRRGQSPPGSADRVPADQILGHWRPLAARRVMAAAGGVTDSSQSGRDPTIEVRLHGGTSRAGCSSPSEVHRTTPPRPPQSVAPQRPRPSTG